jgi:hypothetical protein
MGLPLGLTVADQGTGRMAGCGRVANPLDHEDLVVMLAGGWREAGGHPYKPPNVVVRWRKAT